MKHGQHLDHLKIQGLRGLSNFELDGLGSFNILIGANDVGKTTVLEAIFILSGFLNQELPIRIQNWRNFLVNRFDAFTPLFHNLEMNTEVRLAARSIDTTIRELVISAPHSIPKSESQQVGSISNGDAVEIHPDENQRIQYSSSGLSGPRVLHYAAKRKSPSGDVVSFSNQLRVRDGNIEMTRAPDAKANEILSTRFFYGSYGYEGSIIGDVIVNKKADELIGYLNIINPRIQGVTVSGDVVYLDIGLKQMMPLNMFGSGMIRAATILSTCILGNDRIVLIDELDNGLHYSAITPLVGVLLRLSELSGVQIIATTHSLGLLKSLREVLVQEEFSRNQNTSKFFALQRDSHGEVRSYRYEYDQFEHCISQGIEIR